MRSSHSRIAVAAICSGVLVAGGIGAASADAAAPAKSGTETFLIAVSGNSESVVAHGLFAGGGRDDASHDNYDILHLGGGTVRINHPEAQSIFTQKIDPKTCFISFKITGRYTLSNGTGKYAGVSGHGNYVVLEQGILARTKKGACSQEQEPIVRAGVINASGPATIR